MLKRMTLQMLIAASLIGLIAGTWTLAADPRPDTRWEHD